MRTLKQPGARKTANALAERLLDHRASNWKIRSDVRDFDARVDRMMEQTKQITADLKQIGKK